MVFVCRYVERFRSYALPIDDGSAGSSAKFKVLPRQIFLGWGKKNSQLGFRA